MTMLRWVLLSGLVGKLTAADADADELVRDAIIHIRHGGFDQQRTFLGWTADGHRAVTYEPWCEGQDERDHSTWCGARLEVVGGTSVDLLNVNCEANNGPPCPITTVQASAAIHAEATARAQLGPLSPSAHPAPAVTVARADCRVWLNVAGRPRVAMHAIGPKGCIADGGNTVIHDVAISDVELTPDRAHVLVVITGKDLDTDAWLPFEEARILPLPR